MFLNDVRIIEAYLLDINLSLPISQHYLGHGRTMTHKKIHVLSLQNIDLLYTLDKRGFCGDL